MVGRGVAGDMKLSVACENDAPFNGFGLGVR